MKEILVTSSFLILALLVLRWLFRNSISCRVRYALWGLVLLRLLTPVSLPALDFSVLSAAQSVETAGLGNYAVYVGPVAQARPMFSYIEEPSEETPNWVVLDRTEGKVEEYGDTVNGESAASAVYSDDMQQVTWYETAVSLEEILTAAWIAGMAVMACWMGISNLRFRNFLRKHRVPYETANYRYPVFLVENGLCSPCLFGCFRPAIYLTPAAIENEKTLRHVIAHETTHGRHLDLLWALLRSLCLVIYWFDPLVWIAAKVSKTDCELACDEGAMRRLGEEERLGYGQTLLTLIPVRRNRSPLLSATTMMSDKKRLKDRILRIAEDRKTVVAGLVVVLLAVILLGILAFSGAKETEDPAPQENAPIAEEHQEEDQPQERAEQTGDAENAQALSGDELSFFNEVFFGSVVDEKGVSHVNIRCQFLTSSYETAAQIDLFELFYNGVGPESVEIHSAMTQEEIETVSSGACPTDKLPVEKLDEILLNYTGLTLGETEQIGLNHFRYLEEYNAYYHTHGDTNSPSGVVMQCGVRDGDEVRLYHQYGSSASGWMCLTLLDRGAGNYWFRSNVPCKAPRIQPNLPEGAPLMTISLKDLDPLEITPVEIVPASGDCAERGGSYWSENQDMTVRIYLSTDEQVYAAFVYEEAVEDGMMTVWEVGRFFQFPEGTRLEDCRLRSFSDLFGMQGVIISYEDFYEGNQEEGGPYGTKHDYYILHPETNELCYLATLFSEQMPKQMDLNGDGVKELVAVGGTTAHMLFERDGQIHLADLVSLLHAVWPDVHFIPHGEWNQNYRSLQCVVNVYTPQWGESAHTSCVWEAYFDGDNLLVYSQTSETVDHISEAASQAG